MQPVRSPTSLSADRVRGTPRPGRLISAAGPGRGVPAGVAGTRGEDLMALLTLALLVAMLLGVWIVTVRDWLEEAEREGGREYVRALVRAAYDPRSRGTGSA